MRMDRILHNYKRLDDCASNVMRECLSVCEKKPDICNTQYSLK